MIEKVNINIEDTVRNEVGKLLLYESNEIPSDMNLFHLGLDSIGFVTLVVAIEEIVKKDLSDKFFDIEKDVSIEKICEIINN